MINTDRNHVCPSFGKLVLANQTKTKQWFVNDNLIGKIVRLVLKRFGKEMVSCYLSQKDFETKSRKILITRTNLEKFLRKSFPQYSTIPEKEWFHKVLEISLHPVKKEVLDLGDGKKPILLLNRDERNKYDMHLEVCGTDEKSPPILPNLMKVMDKTAQLVPKDNVTIKDVAFLKVEMTGLPVFPMKFDCVIALKCGRKRTYNFNRGDIDIFRKVVGNDKIIESLKWINDPDDKANLEEIKFVQDSLKNIFLKPRQISYL